MDYREAEAYLQEAAKRGSCLGLERIRALLACLGNPQDELKFVHIAGTNGKGSVLAYVSTVLCEAGYRVGCYSSPAVMDPLERIRVNGENIRREQYARLALKVKEAEEAAEKAAENPAGATIFEVETAIAFLYFFEERCDLVVLEAGLGGALDATNVVKNTVCAVFSSISRDHLGVLGNTIEEIAENKAGIIKPGCTVVSARQPDAVRAVMQKRVKECAKTAPRLAYRSGRQTPGDCIISPAETASNDAGLYQKTEPEEIRPYREAEPNKVEPDQKTQSDKNESYCKAAPDKNESYRGAASGKNESCREAAQDKYRLYREAEPDKLAVEEENFRRLCVSYKTHRHITSRLTGAGQKENLPTALEVLDALRERGYAIPEEAVHCGIEKTRWPGRFTCLSEDPLLFIDGAHNEDAAKKLRATIEQTLSGYRLVLILGVFRDKEYKKICEILCPLAETVYTVDLPDKARSLSAKELAETARRYCRDVRTGAGIRETVEEAVEEVKKNSINTDGQKEDTGKEKAAEKEEAAAKQEAAGKEKVEAKQEAAGKEKAAAEKRTGAEEHSEMRRAVLACGSLSYLKEVSRAAKELL